MSRPRRTALRRAGLRKRTPCQGCGDHGRYDPRELLIKGEGCWHWRLRWLCPMCWLMLEELAGWNEPGVQISEEG